MKNKPIALTAFLDIFAYAKEDCEILITKFYL